MAKAAAEVGVKQTPLSVSAAIPPASPQPVSEPFRLVGLGWVRCYTVWTRGLVICGVNKQERSEVGLVAADALAR